MITRTEATGQILAAKQQKNTTFVAIAEAVGHSKEWVTTGIWYNHQGSYPRNVW